MLRLLLLWGSLLFGVVSSSPTPRKLFGEITSPNYPNPYPNNNISTWDITVPKGFVVNLDFWQFDLQPSESCLSDYVKITADKKDLGRYCGQLGSATGNHPGVREFVSTGNQMGLMFHSDFSNEENGTLIPYMGFLAYYQAVGIQCPQPVPRDQFTLIKDLQPLYRFHDYVNVSCQTGYELMEGDQKLASFSAVCQDDGTWHRPMPRCEICPGIERGRNWGNQFTHCRGVWPAPESNTSKPHRKFTDCRGVWPAPEGTDMSDTLEKMDLARLQLQLLEAEKEREEATHKREEANHKREMEVLQAREANHKREMEILQAREADHKRQMELKDKDLEIARATPPVPAQPNNPSPATVPHPKKFLTYRTGDDVDL